MMEWGVGLRRDHNVYLWKIEFPYFCLLGKEIKHNRQRTKMIGLREKGDMKLLRGMN